MRRETRQEKKRKAMAMRAKELESFGMQVNEKGQVIVEPPSQLVKEMEEALVEEAGLKCCICLEGYRNQPKKVDQLLISFIQDICCWAKIHKSGSLLVVIIPFNMVAKSLSSFNHSRFLLKALF